MPTTSVGTFFKLIDPEGDEWGEVWLDTKASWLNTMAEGMRSLRYRPVSVDAYDSVWESQPEDRYCVVWKRESNIHAWSARFSVTKQELLQFYADNFKANCFPIMVTAAGIPPRFSLVCQYRPNGPESRLSFHDTKLGLVTAMQGMRWGQYTLRWAASYSREWKYDPSRFIAIYKKNVADYEVFWNASVHRASATVLAVMQAHQRANARPALIACNSRPQLWPPPDPAPEGWTVPDTATNFLCVWHNDRIEPGATVLRIARSTIEGDLTNAASNGFFPYRLTAMGFPTGGRFVVFFAKNETPLPRVANVRRLRQLPGGTAIQSLKPETSDRVPSDVATVDDSPVEATPPPTLAEIHQTLQKANREAAIKALDDYVIFHMKKRNIRAGSLAVTHQGRLVLAHAYTWAEPDYPITAPHNAFLLGSIAKAIMRVGLHRLFGQGELAPTDWLLAADPFPQSLNVGLQDPEWSGIQIQDLIAHRVAWHGWEEGAAKMYGGPDEFALAKTLGRKPLERDDVIREAAITADVLEPNTPLEDDPKYYSNWGYTVLGHVIQSNRNRPCADWIKEAVWKNIGFTDDHFEGRRLDVFLLADGTVIPHHVPVEMGVPTVSECLFQFGRLESQAYDLSPKLADAAGGWSAAPYDLLRLYAAFDDDAYAERLMSWLPRQMLWFGAPGSTALPRYVDVSGLRGVHWRGHNGGRPGGYADSFRNTDTKVSIAYAFNADTPKTGTKKWEKGPFMSNALLADLADAIQKTGAFDNVDLWPLVGLEPIVP